MGSSQLLINSLFEMEFSPSIMGPKVATAFLAEEAATAVAILKQGSASIAEKQHLDGSSEASEMQADTDTGSSLPTTSLRFEPDPDGRNVEKREAGAAKDSTKTQPGQPNTAQTLRDNSRKKSTSNTTKCENCLDYHARPCEWSCRACGADHHFLACKYKDYICSCTKFPYHLLHHCKVACTMCQGKHRHRATHCAARCACCGSLGHAMTNCIIQKWYGSRCNYCKGIHLVQDCPCRCRFCKDFHRSDKDCPFLTRTACVVDALKPTLKGEGAGGP
ncbi:uncharacterized protein BCR38DRAFT_235548 [Pseudomassariella vexata]|uniref:Uncharacterized protein n=1 Tax=Pseudomassariella vexata TaxID=1141098 RepID=A0A1Y2DST6_9PEZI|nr:uncharacterized protein BCR38DRAFT_235548 [Pseudomassariella vexata]ORY62229.1 hypothetical protein BCR38DRAFT_235548 [Pseudomassariella vexata]